MIWFISSVILNFRLAVLEWLVRKKVPMPRFKILAFFLQEMKTADIETRIQKFPDLADMICYIILLTSDYMDILPR